MSINGIGSSFTNYYTNSVSSGNPVASASVSVQGIPADVLEISSKSLFSGISTGRRIAEIKSNDLPNNFSNVSTSLFRTGKNTALFSGVVSLAKNSFDFMNGSITGSRLGGNVTADIAGGLGGGIMAAGAGSLVTGMINSGMTGGIVGFLTGAVVFAGTEMLYRNSGLYQNISDKVTTFIDNLLNRQPPPGGW